MKLKKDFYQVASDMQQSAYHAAYSQLKNAQYANNGYSSPMDAFSEAIAKAVSQGVYQAMITLKANQYTDEDFEKDIGLKP